MVAFWFVINISWSINWLSWHHYDSVMNKFQTKIPNKTPYNVLLETMSTCHYKIRMTLNDSSHKRLWHWHNVYDTFMTVSCHCYDSDMTLLWRYLQIKCYQSGWLTRRTWVRASEADVIFLGTATLDNRAGSMVKRFIACSSKKRGEKIKDLFLSIQTQT